MRRDEGELGRVKRVHPHAWLWEPLESDPTFVLGSMFGTKIAIMGGKLMLCFAAREDPWRGILVPTERAHHDSLKAEFPSFAPHHILGKWLYLPESSDTFERDAAALVALARRRDPRIGIVSKRKARARKAKRLPVR
jgi:hypothetical protein